MPRPDTRSFLLLQGPHGPFFAQLGKMLRRTGAQVWRVGFNAGDQAFWLGNAGYLPFRGSPEDWPDTLRAILTEKTITDIVLYGDTRPIHAKAIRVAKAAGLTVHVFEEGYMRPYWVTYERDGSNGHSPLIHTSLAQMQSVLAQTDTDLPEAPARWGDMRQHVFYGALYHWFVLALNHRYAKFRPHRALPLRQEAALYTARLLLMPWHIGQRWVRTARIKRSGMPYHIALLQLEHDASFLAHSPFDRMEQFLTPVIDGFAKGAPKHHHLVFKAHPLESGRSPLARLIRDLARQAGIADRVHYVPGGKLARLLDGARSAVTINSTAALQVLHRGMPLKMLGRGIYDKFTSDQPLDTFFADPKRPDTNAFRDFRRYLLGTSQVAGGYYSMRGRRRVLRQVVDMMLDPKTPYQRIEEAGNHTPTGLRLVSTR